LLSGESFSSIRYIDRFTVADDRLADPMVWIDMAETPGPTLKP